MALEDLNPAVRVEEILNAADIEPATRLEYFMKKAANEVPKPAGSSDAGKVVTVNEDGDGFELTTPSGGGVYKIITVSTPENPSNSANLAIINGSSELTSADAVSEYLAALEANKYPCACKYVSSWNNNAVYPVVFIDAYLEYLVIIDASDPGYIQYKTVGYISGGSPT